MITAEWQQNPVQPDNFGLRQLDLGQTNISTWRASLDQPVSLVQELAHTLSHDEVKRAKRFRFEQDRKRFIVRRGLLRVILGHQLGIGPNRVEFHYRPAGKPAVAESSERGRLCFNLSQSSGIALYAVCWNREIGVDIEMVRPLAEAEQIAHRFYSLQERAILQGLPQPQKMRAFFNCWTRKEAYLKATGDGLSRPLGDVVVSLSPGEPAKLLSVAGDRDELSRWSLTDLEPVPGYVAAICSGVRG